MTSVDPQVERTLAEAAAAEIPGRGQRAALLESIATALEAQADQIITSASAETALTPDELAPEQARMIGTLRMFAGVVREGSWVRAAISRRAETVIGPNHDVRAMLVPLGPVAVFGSSNFPLAYGVCGGDTASALAAGCAVVVKEHPAHSRTGRLIAAIAREAITAAGCVPGLLGYVENTDPRDFAAARAIVGDHRIRAVGFTGSVTGGLAIEKIAMERPRRIPVFAEMGSPNPVLVTPEAAIERAEFIAEVLADSILARFGQQCTCPGLIFVLGEKQAADKLRDHLAARLAAAPARMMLAPWIRDGYLRRVEACSRLPRVQLIAGAPQPDGERGARACLLDATSAVPAADPSLFEEIFGPAAIFAHVPDAAALPELPSSLTLTVFGATDRDDPIASDLVRRYTLIAGRIIINGVPTGVRVAEGMVHGGPFPATNRPESTAVGPLAIERWCRPICYQNAPEDLLPEELRR